MSNLKIDLGKYNVGEVTPEIANRINGALENVLKNVANLSRDDYKALCEYQDEDGGFKIVTDRSLHGEEALDLYFKPSYYATLILINVRILNIYPVDINKIATALDFCSINNLLGHGYDALKEQIANIKLFCENNILQFMSMYPNLSKNFYELVNNIKKSYEIMIKEGHTYSDWGVNCYDEMSEVISLMNPTRYYLAYGSNLNKSQMMSRCPNAKCAGTSVIKGYRLAFDLYLTIKKDALKEVPVGIWEINEDDERALDRYEGFPNIYRKEYIKVDVNGLQKLCLVYIMNNVLNRMGVNPTKEYILRCEKGYKDFGFDISILNSADNR